MKRIAIVDDHPMAREGIIRWIDTESDLEVCGEADSASTGLDLVLKQNPDIVLTDISLPGKSGLELIKDLRAIQPNLLILVISMHDETIYAQRALRAGARGYIMKHEGGCQIMAAIRTVLSGRVYLSERMAEQILDGFCGPVHMERSGVDSLSDREFEVFQLLGKGLSSIEIADKLHLSPKTVDCHRMNIKKKLSAKKSSELVALAANWVSANSGS